MAGDPRDAQLQRLALAEPERDRDRRQRRGSRDQQQDAADRASYESPVPHRSGC